MSYTVTSRRVVPMVSVGRSIATGRIVETPNAHAGEHAVCVKLQSEFFAWGFATDAASAEAAALDAAIQLECAA